MAWWNDGSSLASSLVALWKCDEASGNRADSVGANTLTDSNSVGSNDGIVYSNAVEVDGSNKSLFINDNVALSMGDIQMFFGGWVYLSDKSQIRIPFAKSDRNVNQRAYYVQYDLTTDRFQAGFNGTGSGASTLVTASSLGSPTVDTWYLILAWHDSVANTINISINGREPDSLSYSAGVFDNTAPFRIGGDTLSGVAGNFWDGRIGPVFVGKNYIPTAQDRLDIFKDKSFTGVTSWWLGNGQIPDANVLEHVTVPDIGQAYVGAAVASGQPWTVAVKSYSYLASANVAHDLFDSQDGHFVAGINTSAAYGFYNGAAWSNVALFATAQEQIWFFVSDGAHIQAYLNNVAVGAASASVIGLHNSGATRWGKSYDSAAAWNNPILYGAVYNKALDAVEQEGLYYALLELDSGSNDFIATSTWAAPLGVTLVDIVCRGSGGDGGTGSGGDGSVTAASGGGGGGGAYAASTDVAVTPGNTYTVTVGTAGGTTATGVVADSESVIADYGRKGGNHVGTGTGGSGGAGGTVSASVGDTRFAGGNGGNGRSAANNPTGGGGGGGAGNAGNGGSGGAGSLGGVPGASGTSGSIGGGAGAVGGTASPISSGGNGTAPGGAAGGASGISPSGPGTGARGQVKITWVYPPAPIDLSPATDTAVAVTVDPTVVKGFVSLTPSATDSIAVTLAPTTVKGSAQVTPVSAASGGGTVADVAVRGSATASPAAAEGRGEAISGGATQDSVSLSPTASAVVGEATGASVESGSATLTPDPVTVVVRTLGGQVAGSNSILEPDPVSAAGSRGGPTVEQGSASSAPSQAQAIAGQVNPTVTKGGMILTPLTALGVAETAAPLTVRGSVNLLPLTASAGSFTEVTVTVVGGGGAVLTPDPAEAIGEIYGPTQGVVGIFDTVDKRMFTGTWKRMH